MLKVSPFAVPQGFSPQEGFGTQEAPAGASRPRPSWDPGLLPTSSEPHGRSTGPSPWEGPPAASGAGCPILFGARVTQVRLPEVMKQEDSCPVVPVGQGLPQL